MSRSRIRLDDLQARGIIGAYDWERRAPQDLTLRVDLFVDLSAAGVSDDLADTIDYGAVAERVRELVTVTEAKLLEHLARHICDRLMAEWALDGVSVEIKKPGAVPGALVSVQMQSGAASTS